MQWQIQSPSWSAPVDAKIETGDQTRAYLCYVCGNDCSLGKDVQDVVEPSREKRTAGLGEIEAADGTELDGQALQENSKQVGEEDDEQEAEAIRGSRGDVGRVIARINWTHTCK